VGSESRPEGQHVTVLIGDNGSGIPDASRRCIVDPFFTTKAVGEDSGRGLDIARPIVEQHDGTIHVESQQGKTEFIVHLPTAG
jgi:nitrogen-specific signal transduction histidine kinase